MIKVITTSLLIPALLLILALAGCASDHADQDAAAREPVPSFRVESEQPDPQSRAITVNIRFLGPVTESQAISAAEFVIADRKESYHTITVKSFLPGVNFNEKPFGVSRFIDGEMTHSYNRASGSVRIPTH